MKYVNPEMEIVELDDSILTTTAGLNSEKKDDNITVPGDSGSGVTPDW